MITVPKFVVAAEKSNTIPFPKNDRTGFESMRPFEDKENEMFETVSQEYSKGTTSKFKEDPNGPKSSRKRKKPQVDNALRENKNLINVNPEHHKPSFNPTRIMNLIKEAKALQAEKPPSVVQFTPTQNKVLSKFVSPLPLPLPGSSRKPWMP